jgi:purine operon repressor
MSTETHLHDLKFRLMTIELLRTAKKHYTYRELAQRTSLPVTVLSRYVKGHVLPTTKRAKNIWSALEKMISLEEELRGRIRFDEFGYFDNTSIICDLSLLNQAAQHALSKFAGHRITKVMTAAVDGIPLATTVSAALGVDLIIAKKTKEVGVHDFTEETYIPSNSAIMMALYIPKGAIKRGDSVLIVDDIIRSGETQRALINLVTKSKAEVAGIFALIAVGEEWKKTIDIPPDCPTEIVLQVKPKFERI